MVHLKTIFDTRRQKSDGTYPIAFRITNVKKVFYIPSGISVEKEYWLEGSRTVRRTHPNAPVINVILNDSYFKIQKAIYDLEANKSFSFELLKAKLSPEKHVQSVKSFTQYTVELIADLRKQKKNGNATVYQTSLNRLTKHVGKDEIYFKDITYGLLISFNNELLGEGVKINSISNYFRALRAIYNKGIKDKLADRFNSPFYDFSIKSEGTRKRAISKSSIINLRKKELTKGSPEWHSLNYFLLSFYLIGISFTDLAYLKPENIEDERLIFKRRKTHKWYNMKLFLEATEIMFYYCKPGQTYILPVLPNDIEEDNQLCKKLIYQWIKTTNKYLKRLGRDIGVEIPLTTYVSRHAFATIAKKMGYSNELIAEALGHSYGNRITSIYLDDFDKDVIDEMHQKVICNAYNL